MYSIFFTIPKMLSIQSKADMPCIKITRVNYDMYIVFSFRDKKHKVTENNVIESKENRVTQG